MSTLTEIQANYKKTRICRSHSRFGPCGLLAKHGGDHAVPIGDGVWFVYRRDGRDVSVGFAKHDRGEWVAL